LQIGEEEVLAAPVSCKAMRKSEALRIPRIRLFLSLMMVGLPAPLAIAI
jgi:hypothetical protein